MNTIQGGVGMLFIAFTLAMVVFLIVKGQTAQGMGRLVQIVAVFVLAAFFFYRSISGNEPGKSNRERCGYVHL